MKRPIGCYYHAIENLPYKYAALYIDNNQTPQVKLFEELVDASKYISTVPVDWKATIYKRCSYLED